MKKLYLFAAMIAVFGVTVAHAGVVTSAGSTTVQPAMKACAKVYKKSHAGVHIVIAGGGSSKGVKTVAKGKVDIGRASRSVKEKEIKKYPDLKIHKIATDGVVLVVNADNPLANLTSAQVEQLFKGEASNWSTVGGHDGEVYLVSMGAEHGTYELFTKKFHLKGVAEEDTITFDKGQAWVAFSQDVALDKVAHDVNAVTFASVGVASDYTTGGKVKVLTLDGIEATPENVVSGKYSVSRPLLLLSKGDPVGEAKDFIAYMQGAECQAIVKGMGYIPLK